MAPELPLLQPSGPCTDPLDLFSQQPRGEAGRHPASGVCGACLSGGGSRPQGRHLSRLTVGRDAGENISNPSILHIGMSSDSRGGLCSCVGLTNCTVRASPRTRRRWALRLGPPLQKPWGAPHPLEGEPLESAGAGFLPKLGEGGGERDPTGCRELCHGSEKCSSLALSSRSLTMLLPSPRICSVDNPTPSPVVQLGLSFSQWVRVTLQGKPAGRDACECVLSGGRGARPAAGHQVGAVPAGFPRRVTLTSKGRHTGIAPRLAAFLQCGRSPLPSSQQTAATAWRNNHLLKGPRPASRYGVEVSVEGGVR